MRDRFGVNAGRLPLGALHARKGAQEGHQLREIPLGGAELRLSQRVRPQFARAQILRIFECQGKTPKLAPKEVFAA